MVPYTKSEVNVFETVDLSVLKIHEDTSYCQQFEKVILDDVLFVPPVFSVAADYKPPSMGNSGSGNGIKFIKLYAQKYSYTEIVLDFTERKLIDVVGLPSGMMLELGSIKGSCSVSGSFPLILKMDNNTTLDALFIVPEIPRKI